MARTMYQTIIKDNFDYFVEKVKLPMRMTVINLAKLFPEPKWDNLEQPSSQVLLEAMGKYQERELLQDGDYGRRAMMIAAFRILIAIYDHDPFYRVRLRWLVDYLTEASKTTRWNIDEDVIPEPHYWEAIGKRTTY